MTDEEIKERYAADDLPPVKNWFLYTYHCFMKLFFFVFFGTGSIVLGIIIFPILKICIHPKMKFQKAARAVVSWTFRMFINFMRITGEIRLNVDDRKAFKNLRSTIVVANHPSILDVVFTISLIPNADCIVRGGLANTVLAGVIRQLYIVNTLDYDHMLPHCRKSLESGTNLIIFPEGTRTPRHGLNQYKKGAARIAYDTDSNIQPFYIGGTDKYGLGKHDALWSYNHERRYLYDIHILPQIKIADYKKLEPQIAAKHLTDKMHEVIAAAAKEIDNREV